LARGAAQRGSKSARMRTFVSKTKHSSVVTQQLHEDLRRQAACLSLAPDVVHDLAQCAGGAQLESLWLQHSGGTVYLIYPVGQALPPL
jgi:hypothetical protein